MEFVVGCRIAILAVVPLASSACFTDPPANDDGESANNTSGVTSGGMQTGSSSVDPTLEGSSTSDATATTDATSTGSLTSTTSTTSSGTSTGPGAFCGDGVADEVDACDMDDLGGLACESFGFVSGNLGCNGDCRFDFMDCEAPAGMVFVPPGRFTMGSEDHSDELPIRDVLLNPFFIDTHEVSAAEYQACMDASVCAVPASTANMQFDDQCNVGLEGREDYPANCVGFEAADAYCTWAERRLPTEAEWEKAARGTQGIRYPWGDGPAPTSPCLHAHNGVGNPGCGTDSTAAVGTYPAGASPYGAEDMAGNVWEWVSDYYAATYDGAALRNPTGPAGGTQRVLRGGGWYQDSAVEFTASRRHATPLDLSDAFIGFRCVLPAPMPAPL